jgi:adiponectin receptor
MFSSTALPRRTRDLRPRRAARRLSAPTSKRPTLQLCHRSLPRSLEALDLSSASPTQTLASLRFLVLTYLADLERRLSQLESPDFGAWKLQGEFTIEEANQWARTALEMLKGIRADVCSHLPEFHFADLSSLETFVKSHLPDIPDVPNFTEMRSHFPDMEDVRFVLPDMADMRSHLPEMPQLPDMDDVLTDMRLKLDDVRTRFQDLDFQQPLRYIPTLSNHLKNLHSHLSSMELLSGGVSVGSSAMLSDLLDALLSSEVVADILNSTQEVIEEGEEMLEKAAHEVASAVRRSSGGVRLIKYNDLPHQWRNNPFVTQGYRFIPIERWPLLVMSLFTFHNETRE